MKKEFSREQLEGIINTCLIAYKELPEYDDIDYATLILDCVENEPTEDDLAHYAFIGIQLSLRGIKIGGGEIGFYPLEMCEIMHANQ